MTAGGSEAGEGGAPGVRGRRGYSDLVEMSGG